MSQVILKKSRHIFNLVTVLTWSKALAMVVDGAKSSNLTVYKRFEIPLLFIENLIPTMVLLILISIWRFVSMALKTPAQYCSQNSEQKNMIVLLPYHKWPY